MVPTEPGHYVYVIPLSRVYWGRRTNRADRAVKLVRRFVQRHTKVDRVLITNEVNEFIWQRGREKPPRRIKVVVAVKEVEEEGEKKKLAIVRLAGEKLKPGKYEVKTGKKQ